MRKISLVLAAVLLSQTGCFGSFTAIRKLWQFNDGLSSNKFVKWAAFLGLTILPVYTLFALGDVIIFNSVEFWSGTNPLADGSQVGEKNIRLADGSSAILRFEGDTLHVLHGEESYTFVRGDDGMRLFRDGVFVSEVVQTEDGAELRTADGARLAFSEAELQAVDGDLHALRDLAQLRAASCNSALALR
jgi:hypothetical protein